MFNIDDNQCFIVNVILVCYLIIGCIHASMHLKITLITAVLSSILGNQKQIGDSALNSISSNFLYMIHFL